jgi:MFS family permease
VLAGDELQLHLAGCFLVRPRRVALGCDYPTAHMVISESIPSSMRGRLVLGAFAFQAIGALTGTVIGYLVLKNVPEIGAWRWMYATAIIPALLVIIGRFSITESASGRVSSTFFGYAGLRARSRANSACASFLRSLSSSQWARLRWSGIF